MSSPPSQDRHHAGPIPRDCPLRPYGGTLLIGAHRLQLVLHNLGGEEGYRWRVMNRYQRLENSVPTATATEALLTGLKFIVNAELLRPPTPIEVGDVNFTIIYDLDTRGLVLERRGHPNFVLLGTARVEIPGHGHVWHPLGDPYPEDFIRTAHKNSCAALIACAGELIHAGYWP